MSKKKNTTRNDLYQLKERMKGWWKKYIVVDNNFTSRQQFKVDDRKLHLRMTYPLNGNSIVFDVGGYVGEWAQEIVEKYGSNIYIFEPVEKFMQQAKARLGNNSKVRFLPFGLSDTDEQLAIGSDDDASSVFRGDADISIQLRDVKGVIEELGITHIDLLKLNIEGGEYKVLPRMIETGLISLCTDIQVQFHDFYPNAVKLRDDIRKELALTHHLTYDYPFTFENWRKNA